MTKKNNRYFGVLSLSLFVIVSLFFYQWKGSVNLTKQTTVTPKEEYTSVETPVEGGVRIDYYNSSGELCMPNGYFTTRINIKDDKGRIVEVSYFVREKAVAAAFGQFVEKYKYDEKNQRTEIAYFGENGELVNSKLGYAILRRNFYEDGKVKDEMYYDEYGNRAQLADGQYGVRHVKDKIYFLDKDGKTYFDLKQFLYHNQWTVVVIGAGICILLALVPLMTVYPFLVIYFCFICYQTLMRGTENGGIDLSLFWSYRQFLSNASLRCQILNNIWLFVPLGAALGRLYNKLKYRYVILLIPVAISVLIETLQYVLGLGLCELDDIISNGIGGMIGVFSIMELRRTVKMNKR